MEYRQLGRSGLRVSAVTLRTYRRGVEAPAGSRHLSSWDERPVHDEDKLYDLIETLVGIGHADGCARRGVALAGVLAKPAITSVIVGARTGEQLTDDLASVVLELSDEEMSRFEAFSAQPLDYAYWHQAKTAGDRLIPADLSLLGPHIS